MPMCLITLKSRGMHFLAERGNEKIVTRNSQPATRGRMFVPFYNIITEDVLTI